MIFKYPYTDLYNLNLDWVIQAIKEVQETITNLGTVVNTFNGQSGDVTLSAADIASIVGGIVNSFNGRTGAVTLTEADVNATLIDIVWTSDPGEVIGDLSQSTLNELFAAGRRVLIFNNALGEPDRIYFLTLVNDTPTPQQYIPTGAIAGVASVNGQTGAVTVRGDTIPVSGTDPTTVEDALAAKEDVLTFDQTPTAGSTNPVTSAGIQAADAAIRTDLATLSNTVSGIDNRLESAEQGLTYAEQDISTLSQQIANVQNGLATLNIIGTINNSGSTIYKNSFFWLNGNLCVATADISNGAEFTLSNYITVPTGGFNTLVSTKTVSITSTGRTFPPEIELYGPNYYVKCGRIIVLTVDLKINSSTIKSLAIGNYITDPNACPILDVSVTAGNGVIDGLVQPFTIRNSGNLTLWNTKTGITYCQGTIIYIAKGL